MVILSGDAKMIVRFLLFIQVRGRDMRDRPTVYGSEEDRAKRREFLKKCGRFAVVTPPAMTMLMSVASMPKEAHASTIGRHHRGRSEGGDSQGGDDNSQD